jgi:hypothetical protein
MSCRFDKEIIQKYIDNTIDPLEQLFLKEHIKCCGECSSELELLMSAEDELDKFFSSSTVSKELDFMIETIVDDCIEEIESSPLKRSIRMGRRIASNSSKFVDFIPGIKYAKKGVKKAASKSGSLVSAVVRKRIRRLLTN